MRKPGVLVSLTMAGLLSACVGTSGTPSREFTTLILHPTERVLGETGRAFLMPQGNDTRVLIEVSGVPGQVSSRPVHLYTFIYQGICGRLGREPTYALLQRVLAQSPSSLGRPRGPFTVSNTAPLPMQKLRDGNYAIVVQTAPADGNIRIFCGDVS